MNSSSAYKNLASEIQPYKALLAKASDSILDQEITKYPIFVLHQHDIEVGIPITKDDSLWKIHASSLEEFVSKQIIEQNKIDSFRTIFKSP